MENANAKKRARESDADDDAEGQEEQKLSKKQLKKLKKQKSQDIPATNGDVKAPAKETAKIAKEDKKEKEKKEKEKGKKEEKTTPVKSELPKGLVIEDKKVGDGKAAKKGDLVAMRYIGKFQDSKKVFDSNTKGKPVSIPSSRTMI